MRMSFLRYTWEYKESSHWKHGSGRDTEGAAVNQVESIPNGEEIIMNKKNSTVLLPTPFHSEYTLLTGHDSLNKDMDFAF